jgi:hypothetical protein
MDERAQRLDRAARAFNDAAAALALELAQHVNDREPELLAKVEAALLAHGHRLVVAWESHPESPAIWMATVDDYERMRRIVTVPAQAPGKRH